MQKISFRKTATSLRVEFSSGNKFYSGTLVDLKEDSMIIHAEICFPFDLMFDVCIFSKKRCIQVPVKLESLNKINTYKTNNKNKNVNK